MDFLLKKLPLFARNIALRLEVLKFFLPSLFHFYTIIWAQPSLETPVGDSEDAFIKDFIESENDFSPADTVASTDLKERVREVLKSLTPREEKVLKMRFGIDVASEHTLEEVGKDFSVTR